MTSPMVIEENMSKDLSLVESFQKTESRADVHLGAVIAV